MSTVNSVNSLVGGTVDSLDPTTPAVMATQQMASGLGGGLGGVILSMPNIGGSFANFLNTIGDQLRGGFNYVKSGTPSSISTANSAAQDNSGNRPSETLTHKVEASVSLFFSTIFTQTLYIVLFGVAIFVCLIGSSIAANHIGTGKLPIYYAYYMLYGFIITGIPLYFGGYMALKDGNTTAQSIGYMTGGFLVSFIPMTVLIYKRKKNTKIFYSLLAPLIKGNYMGLFSYNAGSDLSTITSGLTASRPQVLVRGLSDGKMIIGPPK